MKTITRTVWILSLISLLTDTASEMLYPVMPVFLQSIGFSVLLIGILEGVAEAFLINVMAKARRSLTPFRQSPSSKLSRNINKP